MMNNCQRKKVLRAEMARCRNELGAEEKAVWDNRLCQMVLSELEKISMSEKLSVLEQVSAAEKVKYSWIFLYMDIRREAGTRNILEAFWKNHIPTALPKVEGSELRFYSVFGEEDLLPGYMGIPEPSGNTAMVEAEDALVLVPGLAFDRRGFRLGYGGGFYDRFFARCPNSRRWGLAYEFQLVEEVPHEPWDQKVERIVTPQQIIDCGLME